MVKTKARYEIFTTAEHTETEQGAQDVSMGSFASFEDVVHALRKDANLYAVDYEKQKKLFLAKKACVGVKE